MKNERCKMKNGMLGGQLSLSFDMPAFVYDGPPRPSKGRAIIRRLLKEALEDDDISWENVPNYLPSSSAIDMEKEVWYTPIVGLEEWERRPFPHSISQNGVVICPEE